MKSVVSSFVAVLLLAFATEIQASTIRGNIASDPDRESHSRHAKVERRQQTNVDASKQESSKSLLDKITFEHMTSTYPTLVTSLESIWGVVEKDAVVKEKRS